MSRRPIVIVGSGIAATTVAYHLTQAGHTVEMFEKGPAFPYPHAQQYAEQIHYFYENPAFKLPSDVQNHTIAGDYRHELENERGMVVGGSATHWWGTTPRMIPSDFQTQSRFGYGADWPISYDDLEPYYVRAERHIGVSGTTDDTSFAPWRSAPYPLPPFALSAFDRTAQTQLREAGIEIHTTPQARLRAAYDDRAGCANFGVCHVCPIGARYSPNHHLQRVLDTGRCTLHTNTSVRRIVMDANGRAEGVLVQRNDAATPQERPARLVVVAAGAIETARLLLLSTSPTHPDGVGNDGGHVGRNLTFHHIWSTPIRLHAPVHGGRVGPATARSFQFLDPETRGRHGGVNLGLDDRIDLRWLAPTLDYWDAASGEAMLERMRPYLLHHRTVNFHAESIPDDGKYVALSDATDRFGDPFAHVQYTSADFDVATFAYAQSLSKRITDALDADVSAPMEDPTNYDSGAHHMGTCRMGDGPGDSVVDAYGRVHGTDNLFVAGSSVFVGGSGSVQPTLTLTALAIRTADYLIDQFAAPHS